MLPELPDVANYYGSLEPITSTKAKHLHIAFQMGTVSSGAETNWTLWLSSSLKGLFLGTVFKDPFVVLFFPFNIYCKCTDATVTKNTGSTIGVTLYRFVCVFSSSMYITDEKTHTYIVEPLKYFSTYSLSVSIWLKDIMKMYYVEPPSNTIVHIFIQADVGNLLKNIIYLVQISYL